MYDWDKMKTARSGLTIRYMYLKRDCWLEIWFYIRKVLRPAKSIKVFRDFPHVALHVSHAAHPMGTSNFALVQPSKC
jgi:hypothetical protein